MTNLELLAKQIHAKGDGRIFTCNRIRAIGMDKLLYNKIMSPYGWRSTTCWMEYGKSAIGCPIERNQVRQNLVLLYQEFLNDQPTG